MATDFEDLAHPPSGGWLKMIILGIIVPGIVACYGYQGWNSQEIGWLGHSRRPRIRC